MRIISERNWRHLEALWQDVVDHQVELAYTEGKIDGMREIAASIVEDARERALAYERETLAMGDDSEAQKLYLYGATHSLAFMAESLEAVMSETGMSGMGE